MQHTALENVVTTSVVARLLGVSEVYVRQLERSGRLTAGRLANGTRLFDREAVEQLQRERAAVSR